ncbi:helix-turn-helix transcriptional regulator [Flavobacterium supellecticarium]|uniref:Helix-turn-helix transcriptional regulator n=1 Tax=Flavobacterium supellecticarium TaxID=2565924 RepID=A0A4V3W8Y2_9FLAO|nr:helix-turn-helix transcriptional regulator [Flavobacterium supellecticarium]THF53056.1 helix-turn-helix transcriptional regulator [Flavobacterium supellecticarium]
MVNTDDFIKRLEILLEYYGLSASAFADSIGVQRSSLSHLLSGRNKPSLDFILKIIAYYPEVDLYWILNGKGEFPKQELTPVPPPTVVASDLFTTPEESVEAVSEPKPYLSLKDADEIERIVIFFKNGTFKEYIQK